jgi:hypothetical protein
MKGKPRVPAGGVVTLGDAIPAAWARGGGAWTNSATKAEARRAVSTMPAERCALLCGAGSRHVIFSVLAGGRLPLAGTKTGYERKRSPMNSAI